MLGAARNDQKLISAALDAMSEKVLVLDTAGRIVLANQAWRGFLDRQSCLAPNHGIGRTLRSLEILRSDDLQSAAALSGLDRVVAGARAHFTGTCCMGASRKRWFRLHAAHVDLHRWAKVVLTLDDISDVQLARRAVKRMSLRLTSLQQQERQRIALDLHDSTAQHIAAASLNLFGLRQRLKVVGPEVVMLDDIERSLQMALRDVRVTSFLLYPSDIGEGGLNETLEHFVRTYTRHTGVSTTIRAPALDFLAVDLQRTILFVVQEALTNVHRHAQSPFAHVSLRVTRESVVLCVTDFGRGMDRRAVSSDTTAGTGLGLPGMRARADQLGGELRVKSRTGHGTRILARFPVARTVRPLPALRELLPRWLRAKPGSRTRSRKYHGVVANPS